MCCYFNMHNLKKDVLYNFYKTWLNLNGFKLKQMSENEVEKCYQV